MSGTNHEADQPPHLTLMNDQTPEDVNFAKFAGPEGRWEHFKKVFKSLHILSSGSVQRECTSTSLMTRATWLSSSMPPTASTVRPVTSRTTARTSTGSVLRVVEDPPMTECNSAQVTSRLAIHKNAKTILALRTHF